MLRFLVVGVGGSGGNTIRYTARELERRLIAAGYRDGLPVGWQFLHIDVRQQADDLQADLPVRLADRIGHLGLAEFPFDYLHYDKEATSTPPVLPALARWRPNPQTKIAPPHVGAGQMRGVGRVVAVAEAAAIGRAVDQALTQMSSADALAEMTRLETFLGAAPTPAGAPPAQVIVVSSLGGGAGSGIFLDVIQLLRARAVAGAQWLADPLLVAYAADIFQSVPAALRQGIEPNTLGALSEMLSAYEHTGPMDAAEQAALHRGGGTLPLGQGLSATHTFIVGRSNGEVTMSDSGQVYRSTAKALAAYVQNETVQTEFSTYLAAGWAMGPAAQWAFSSPGGTNPVSSFGYGNVSLGRGIFVAYARERLAAAALRRVREGHLEGLAPGEIVRPETKLAEVVAQDQATYFSATGLWEQGQDNNQVLDALRDPAAKKLSLNALRDKVIESIRRDRGQTELAPEKWLESFEDAFQSAANEYVPKERSEREANARRWAAELPDRVVEATVAVVAARGVPVASELLSHLRNQTLAARDELRAKASEFRGEREGSSVGQALQQARDVFTGLGRKIRGNHAVFGDAATHRRNALQRGTEAELYDFAADLLLDVAENLLPPLSRAIAALGARLEQDLKDQAIRARASQWSVGALGGHLLPAPNEVLLDPVATMPAAFDEQLVAATNAAAPGSALGRAVREVVSGRWVNRLDPAVTASQDLITLQHPWFPKRAEARPPGELPAAAVFQAKSLRINDLPTRAETWVRERQGALSGYIGESLRSWLDPQHVDAAARSTRFAEAISGALDKAAPMVSINPNVMNRLHGQTNVGRAYVISPIPLSPTDAAFPAVSNHLLQAGLTQPQVNGVLNPAAADGEIEIVTFLAAPVHPVVMDSLMTPISQDWLAKRSHASLRSAFWLNRRARPLESFVPISPEHQESIVRGWLTGRILGHVQQAAGGPIKVWTPQGERPFSEALLTSVASLDVALPALFEAFPLALLSYSAGDAQTIEAYERLVHLGSSTPGMVAGSYAALQPELAAWILNGSVTPAQPQCQAAPTPLEALAGSSAANPSDRKATVTTSLDDLSAVYRKLSAEPVTAATALTLDSRWELRDLFTGAIAQLAAAVAAVATDGDPRKPGIG